MFVVVQLPFADVRPFLNGAERLPVPPWPLAEPKREFVRSVGQVTARKRGGVTPWVGEEVYCDARRALRVDSRGLNGRRSACKFRRYLADGSVLARIEVGIVAAPVASRREEPANESAPFPQSPVGTDAERDAETLPVRLTAALGLAFHTPTPSGLARGDLCELHPVLARHLLRSTTRFRTDHPFVGADWWLRPIPPLAVVESRPSEEIAPPQHSQAVPIAIEHGISLHVFAVSVSETPVMVWLLRPSHSTDADALRRLRIHLLRLHAERLALRRVLRLIATERIDISRGSAAFDRLQDYLLKGFHGLDRQRSHGFPQQAILDAAYRADAFISDSERNTVLDQLGQARLNVLRNVERHLLAEAHPVSQPAHNVIHANIHGDLVAGDQYAISGHAGAVGPYARVDSVKVQQVWQELAPTIDLQRLSVELEQLRETLRDRGSQDSQAVTEIAQAAHAAQQGDGPKVLRHLASAGRWVLDVAGEVGADLTAAVIRELLKV